MNKKHREHILLNALPDPRSAAAKARDFQFSDMAMAVPIIWTEKPQSAWRKYTLRNQDGAGSCVGNGTAKALETHDKIVYSAHPVYARRSNSPAEGMFIQNAADILTNSTPEIPNPSKGTTTEALDPSNNLTEQQIDVPVTVLTPKTIKGYGFIPVTDLDSIAAAVDAYGGCPITVSIAWDEWNTEQGIPTYIPNAQVSGGHCLCVTDYILHQGEKSLVCENSWGADSDSLNETGQVLLTQSFLNGRGQQCMFLIPQSMQPTYSIAFTKAVINTLNYEGGYVNNPHDPGGETNFGISKRSYPNVDIKNLTRDGAIAIYYRDYWTPIHGDSMPANLAFNVFDTAVNIGVGTAIKMVQSALGVVADGKIGPKTLAAMSAATKSTVSAFCALRAEYYFSLPGYQTFGKGWINRTMGTLTNSITS